MSVILVNYLRLNELPPAISILETINVTGGIYISLYEEKEYKKLYKNIKFIHVYQKRYEFSGENNFGEKLKYKKLELAQKMARNKIIKYINQNYTEKDYIWFLHESTVLSLGKAISKYKRYFVTLYELDAAQNDKNNKLSYICQHADKIIVPEETRAHIVKAFLNLTNMPYIIHNKPVVVNSSHNIDEETHEAIEKIKAWKTQGIKVYLYSGIFLPERKLDAIISAFTEIPKSKLVFMGRRSYYLEQLEKQYPNCFEYIGFFPAPSHLEVIKQADVGILTYVSQNKSINAIFCAPNKIFEYGEFGLPVIGNDIPGLKYVIEVQNIGCCFAQDNKDEIIRAVCNVTRNYEIYKKNIKKYVDSVDVEEEIRKIIS